jgi:hypothetical protein
LTLIGKKWRGFVGILEINPIKRPVGASLSAHIYESKNFLHKIFQIHHDEGSRHFSSSVSASRPNSFSTFYGSNNSN